ncbi:hypothetical protein B0H21DRAFT_710842 [Amylocystis lapponica]|nr:hypothetical protein B0H21DRAFT_710842 [Amylocystis lapponica]
MFCFWTDVGVGHESRDKVDYSIHIWSPRAALLLLDLNVEGKSKSTVKFVRIRMPITPSSTSSPNNSSFASSPSTALQCQRCTTIYMASQYDFSAQEPQAEGRGHRTVHHTEHLGPYQEALAKANARWEARAKRLVIDRDESRSSNPTAENMSNVSSPPQLPNSAGFPGMAGPTEDTTQYTGYWNPLSTGMATNMFSTLPNTGNSSLSLFDNNLFAFGDNPAGQASQFQYSPFFPEPPIPQFTQASSGSGSQASASEHDADADVDEEFPQHISSPTITATQVPTAIPHRTTALVHRHTSHGHPPPSTPTPRRTLSGRPWYTVFQELKARISQMRGRVKTKARELVKKHYSFESTSEDNVNVINRNRVLATKLKTDSAFVYMDPDNRNVPYTLYRHAIIAEIISMVWFADKASDGAQYPDMFSDHCGIPLVLIALCLAATTETIRCELLNNARWLGVLLAYIRLPRPLLTYAATIPTRTICDTILQQCKVIVDEKTGQTCRYFRWQPGAWPPTGEQSSAASDLADSSDMEIIEPTQKTGAAQGCLYTGCTSSRIHCKCARRLCKKHCLAAGGCPLHQEQQQYQAKLSNAAARKEYIRRSSQHVEIGVWLKNDTEPNFFDLQDGFDWPYFQLDRAMLIKLGFDVNTSPEPFSFKIYSRTRSVWSTVFCDHNIVLSGDDHLFLKALDVTHPLDFDNHRTITVQSGTTDNIRQNLPAQRADVRKKLRGVRAWSVSSSESSANASSAESIAPHDSVVASGPSHSHKCELSNRSQPHIGTNKKVRRRSNPGADTVKAEEIHTNIDLTCDEPAPPIFALGSSSAGSSSSRPITIDDSDQEQSSHPPSPTLPHLSRVRASSYRLKTRCTSWPRDYFAVDVLDGFAYCDSAKERGETVARAFEDHFKIKWNKSTYYEHRKRWDAAPQALRDALVLAGRTNNGRWSVLISSQKRKRGKAAQKHPARRSLSQVDEDEEEGDDDDDSTGVSVGGINYFA